MSPRQRRIEKISEHRGKELDKRVAELTQQKAREEAARLMAERQRQELFLAEEGRSKLASSELRAGDWVEANEWLRKRSAHAEMAEAQAAKARLGTQRARAHVLHARTDLKKIEVLSARIENDERGLRERADRRLQDEMAALRFSADKRRGSNE